MSYGCMYVLRDVRNLEVLRRKLVYIAKIRKCGVCFEPINNLLIEHSIDLSMNDFVFEVCDDFNNNDASLLLSHEGFSINGVQANLPLLQRLKIIQDVALSCMPHAEVIEIFLGEDTPYLPDYSEYRAACPDIADILNKEYQTDGYMAFVPCVHLIIETGIR